MADTLPTIWPAEPHTLAKHGILRTYLKAWAAILSRSRRNTADDLLFVDGFAGPGEYTGGELGSPLVAIDAIARHEGSFAKPVRMQFIESDHKRWAHLKQKLDGIPSQVGSSDKVNIAPPILGDCNQEIRKLIEQRLIVRRSVGPALFFLDQFGYSQVPIELLKLIMNHDKCEVFSYMNFLRLNQFLSDPNKWSGITAAYGDDSWKAALALSGTERETRLRKTYITAIKHKAGAEYVWAFAMFNKDRQLIHWLIFATNSLKGLEEMKRAMWKADGKGTYRFSDRDVPEQQVFLTGFDDDWLADRLATYLRGRTYSEEQLQAYVLTETPCYKFKTAVKRLRRERRATPKSGWPVTFAKNTDESMRPLIAALG